MGDVIRYKKIIILLKTGKDSIESTKLEFEKAMFEIKNTFLIIDTYENKSTTYKIFNINDIHAFKTEQ